MLATFALHLENTSNQQYQKQKDNIDHKRENYGANCQFLGKKDRQIYQKVFVRGTKTTQPFIASCKSS